MFRRIVMLLAVLATFASVALAQVSSVDDYTGDFFLHGLVLGITGGILFGVLSVVYLCDIVAIILGKEARKRDAADSKR